jgi:hypothetical protein
MHETSYGSFIYIIDNIHAFYITSVIIPCVVGFDTPVDAQSKITVLTLVYRLSFFVMLAAHNTSSLLGYIYFLLEVFFLESGVY